MGAAFLIFGQKTDVKRSDFTTVDGQEIIDGVYRLRRGKNVHGGHQNKVASKTNKNSTQNAKK